MPKEIKNITEQVEDFVKYLYYPYVSHSYYPEPQETSPERTLIAEFEHSPDTEYWNLVLRRPDSVMTFNDVRSGPVARAVLPLTATQTLPQNLYDTVAGNDSQRKSFSFRIKKTFYLMTQKGNSFFF